MRGRAVPARSHRGAGLEPPLLVLRQDGAGGARRVARQRGPDGLRIALRPHSNEPDGFEYAMMSDPDSSYEFERGGEEVLWAVAGAAEVSEEVAQEVLDILGDRHADFDSAAMGEEFEYDPESYHERRGPNDIEFQLGWRSFEQSLRTENRFSTRRPRRCWSASSPASRRSATTVVGPSFRPPGRASRSAASTGPGSSTPTTVCVGRWSVPIASSARLLAAWRSPGG